MSANDSNLLENNYREILQRELTRRIQRNPSYSLRAFARDLNLAPSSLSETMRGVIGMSRQTARQVATNLGFAQTQIEFFCDLGESQSSKSTPRRQAATARLKNLRAKPECLMLAKDSFDYISSWHHFAIMALMDTTTGGKRFQATPPEIASRLGITTEDAQNALDRLVRLDLVQRTQNRTRTVYRLNKRSTFTPSGVSPVAMRQFHSEFIQKAKDSISGQTSAERELSASVLTIPSERIDEAREMISAFRKQFVAHFSKYKAHNEVYGLGVQLFRISSPEGTTS